MDGFFPLVAVRFSNLVNSFKDASMVKLVKVTSITNPGLVTCQCQDFCSVTNLEI